MLDQVWCDIHGVYVQGWLHAYARHVQEVALICGTARVATRQFQPRPDLLPHFPGHPHIEQSGFALYLPCAPFQPVWLEARTEAGLTRLPVSVPPHLRDPQEKPWDDPDHPWPRFVMEMRGRSAPVVVEIGARPVGAHSDQVDTNPFGPDCRKIGTDIHPGPGVDVVADVHRLSQAIAPGSADGVFSAAVLEHLAAPWLAAAEINHILKPGGWTLHIVPQSWPVHEEPNDFWRMSDRGLSVLFGPATGFEVIEAGMRGAVRIHPSPAMRKVGWHDMPGSAGYAEAYVLARKVAELPAGAVAWPSDAAALAELSRAYPNR